VASSLPTETKSTLSALKDILITQKKLHQISRLFLARWRIMYGTPILSSIISTDPPSFSGTVLKNSV